MMRTTSLWKATALAVPLGMFGFGAHAADIVATAQDQEGFSTFAKAVEAAGMRETLEGDGPYTVFAPTDQAFEQLPEGALDELMKEENQDQLKTLLQHHVIEGQELKAGDVIGQQTKVDTLSGDSLTVDGTGQVVLLVPTGLTITRVGDQVIIERQGAAVTAPAVEVGSQAATGSGDSPQQATGTSGARTEVTEQGGMPMSEHQQQALESDPQQEQRQTAGQGTEMPSTEHQREVLAGSEQSDGQQHAREQVRSQDVLREATVVQPDIQADNGVIHGVDAVLVPEKLLSKLEGMQSQSQQIQGQQPNQTQQGPAKQG